MLPGPDFAKLYIVGSVNVDVMLGTLDALPPRGTEILMRRSECRVGGNAANAALAFRALGGGCQVVSNIGADMFGDWVAGHFPADSRGWPRSDRPTTLTIGLAHSDGERTFLTTQGHLAAFRPDDVLAQLPERAAPGDIALLCSPFLSPDIMDGLRALIEAVRGRGFATALDTGWPLDGWSDGIRSKTAEWLALTDHVLMNEIEVLGLADTDRLDDALARLNSRLAPGATLVVKRGSLGATAWRRAETASVAAPRVEVIDTIGAGDIFNAGYLYSCMQGRPLADCLSLGIETASHAISTAPRHYRPRRRA